MLPLILNATGFYNITTEPYQTLELNLPNQTSAFIISSISLTPIANITFNNESNSTVLSAVNSLGNNKALRIDSQITNITLGNYSTHLQIWVINTNACPGISLTTTSPTYSDLLFETLLPSALCVFFPAGNPTAKFSIETDNPTPGFATVWDTNNVESASYICPQGSECYFNTDIPVFVSFINFYGNKIKIRRDPANNEDVFNNCTINSFIQINQTAVTLLNLPYSNIEYDCYTIEKLSTWEEYEGLWIFLIIVGCILVVSGVIYCASYYTYKKKSDNSNKPPEDQTPQSTSFANSPYEAGVSTALNP